MKLLPGMKYEMDGYLKAELDDFLFNNEKEWDFVLLISGSGMTRSGKTMLGQQIGAYWAHETQTKWSHENICFTKEELIKKGTEFPKHSAFVVDEARDELKTSNRRGSILLDFLAECGKYNHLIIIILPDFFELKKSIAINRSAALLNVQVTFEKATKKGNEDRILFKRGKFGFFGPSKKRMLYVIGKKQYDNYAAVPPNFVGEFKKHWTVDEIAYDKRKDTFIKRNREEVTKSVRSIKAFEQRDICIRLINEHICTNMKKTSEFLSKNGLRISYRQIQNIINQKVIENSQNRGGVPENEAY